jgi:hypothetical protein
MPGLGGAQRCDSIDRLSRRGPCVYENFCVLIWRRNRLTSLGNDGLLIFFLRQLVLPFKSKSRLEAENGALRKSRALRSRRDQWLPLRLQLRHPRASFFVRRNVCLGGEHGEFYR